MYSLYKLAKRKRGVSPVIAVVLLIALTVAAAAVIWAITNNVLNSGTSTFIVDTTNTSTNATHAIWTGTIQVSEETTITGASLVDQTLTETIETGTVLSPGEQNVRVAFDDPNLSGSYQIQFEYTVGGGNPQLSEPVTITFS